MADNDSKVPLPNLEGNEPLPDHVVAVQDGPESLARGAADLNMELPELVAVVCEALRPISRELGLGA